MPRARISRFFASLIACLAVVIIWPNSSIAQISIPEVTDVLATDPPSECVCVKYSTAGGTGHFNIYIRNPGLGGVVKKKLDAASDSVPLDLKTRNGYFLIELQDEGTNIIYGARFSLVDGNVHHFESTGIAFQKPPLTRVAVPTVMGTCDLTNLRGNELVRIPGIPNIIDKVKLSFIGETSSCVNQNHGAGPDFVRGGSPGSARTLRTTLLFQPQNAVFESSFGTGLFCEYDWSVFLETDTTGVATHFPWGVRIFDPVLGHAVSYFGDLHDPVDNEIIDGLLDQGNSEIPDPEDEIKNHYYKKVQLVYQADQNATMMPAGSLEDANFLIIEKHDGTVFKFELAKHDPYDGLGNGWENVDIEAEPVGQVDEVAGDPDRELDREGRLVEIRDPRDAGRVTKINYWDTESRQNGESWEHRQIKTVTDPAGNAMTFRHKPTNFDSPSGTCPASEGCGRYAVAKIELPDNVTVDFEYQNETNYPNDNNFFVKTISLPEVNGTIPKYTFTVDEAEKTIPNVDHAICLALDLSSTLISIDSPFADKKNHRISKDFYRMGGGCYPGYEGDEPETENQPREITFVNQPANVLRSTMVDLGGSEDVLLSIFVAQYVDPGTPNGGDDNPLEADTLRILRSGYRLSDVRVASERINYEWCIDNFDLTQFNSFESFSPITDDGCSFTYENIGPANMLQSIAEFEPIYGASAKAVLETGEELTCTYDDDKFLTRRCYQDVTCDPNGVPTGDTYEEFERDPVFKQITHHRDRNGNITKFEYDLDGRLTKRIEGFGTSEQAEYRFVYYGNGLLKTEFMPQADPVNPSPDIHRTDYVYDDATLLLKSIQYPAFTEGGFRPTTTFFYDNAGLLEKSIAETTNDPVSGVLIRIVTFEYDALGRKTRETNIDPAGADVFKTWDYGVPVCHNTGTLDCSNKSRLIRRTDRRGVSTEYEYDVQGRVVKETRGIVHDQEPPNPLVTIESNTHYTFWHTTDKFASVETDGKRVEYKYDYKLRVTEKKEFPNAGKTLVSTTVYDGTNLHLEKDPCCFKTFHGLVRQSVDEPDSRLEEGEYTWKRTVQFLKPEQPETDYEYNEIMEQGQNQIDREPSPPDAEYIIEDRFFDSESNLVRFVDGRGNVTRYAFDSRNRQSSEIQQVTQTDSSGASQLVDVITETDFNVDNTLNQFRWPRYFDNNDPQQSKVRTTYLYNGRGLLEKKTEAPGAPSNVAGTSTFTYFADGQVSSIKDPRGHSWNTWYDPVFGRIQGRTRPASDGIIFNTDAEGNVTHQIFVSTVNGGIVANPHDPPAAQTMGETTTRFDALGRPFAQTRWLTAQGFIDQDYPEIADGTTSDIVTHTLYDIRIGDGEDLDSMGGLLTSSLQKLAESVDDGGADTTFGSGSYGSAIAEINGEGEISATILDAIDRPVMQVLIDPDDNTLISWTCTRYDQIALVGTVPVGVEVETVSPNPDVDDVGQPGVSAIEILNGAEWTKVEIDAAGNETTYLHDANGNVFNWLDANLVGMTLISYDELDRPIERVDTYEDITKTRYDLAGNVIAKEDAKGKETLASYDARGRRIELTDRLEFSTTFRHDRNGNLLEIDDAEPGDAKSKYTYTKQNQRAQINSPDHLGGTHGSPNWDRMFNGYDKNQRLSSTRVQDGGIVRFRYDMADRMNNRDYFSGGPGTPITARDHFEYDKVSRIVEAISDRSGTSVSIEFDDAGRIETESLEYAGQIYTTRFEYNPAGLVDMIIYPDDSEVVRKYNNRGILREVLLDGIAIDSRTWDEGGRLQSSQYGNGITTEITYRDDDELDKKDNQIAVIKTIHPRAALFSVGEYFYEYDPNKLRTTERNDGEARFSSVAGYDDAGRIESWRIDHDLYGWTYSAVDDWYKVQFNSKTVEIRTHTDAHELTGLNTVALSHDAKGNLADNNNSHTYKWDFDNRLEEVNDGSQRIATYYYDALGRKVAKETDSQTEVYVNAEHDVVAIYTAGTSTNTPKQRIVYGSEIDEPIMLIQATPVGDEQYYYHRNFQNSVIACSDSAGEVAERYQYQPYGKTTILSDKGDTILANSLIGNQFMFTGRSYDAETGLYHFRSREYEPNIGRFMQRDKLGFVDGLNLYAAYFAINGTDPMGTSVVSDSPIDDVFRQHDVPFTREKVFDQYVYSSRPERIDQPNNIWESGIPVYDRNATQNLTLSRMLKSDSMFELKDRSHIRETRSLNRILADRLDTIERQLGSGFRNRWDVSNDTRPTNWNYHLQFPGMDQRCNNCFAEPYSMNSVFSPHTFPDLTGQKKHYIPGDLRPRVNAGFGGNSWSPPANQDLFRK